MKSTAEDKARWLTGLDRVNQRRLTAAGLKPTDRTAYPIAVPEINFAADQEVILLDFPARALIQLPVGLAFVHDALKRAGFRVQTVDLDIIFYHRFHRNQMRGGSAPDLPSDPWQPINFRTWKKNEILDYFQSGIEEIAAKLIRARPRIVACSLQEANLGFASRVIERVRRELTDLIVIVGGMSCLEPDSARGLFPAADYTVVGEAELIIGPLVDRLLRGERVRNMPGVWSRYDPPERCFEPGPVMDDLNRLDFPRYGWTDLRLYRTADNYHLVPIVAARGCPWAGCRFCTERFRWRVREADGIVEELAFFNKLGFVNFCFNESDCLGDPAVTEAVCDGILARGLKLRLTGQCRCLKGVEEPFFRKLAQAGFGCLHFGVDGWSEHALKLMRKGYTKAVIRRNLKLATAAGLETQANVIIGLPGETEADFQEALAFIVQMKPYLDRISFINPLLLIRGSDYWRRPERFGIRFKGDQAEIYRDQPLQVPDKAWYSEEPFNDSSTRYKRYQRLLEVLGKNDIPFNPSLNFTPPGPPGSERGHD